MNEATYSGKWDVVQWLGGKHADVNAIIKNGKTLLHLATSSAS